MLRYARPLFSDRAFSLAITGGLSPVPFTSPFAKSRHLYTGYPMANMKAPAIVVPQTTHFHGFEHQLCVSMHHQWFTCVRLFANHLTPLTKPFPQRSAHSRFRSCTLRWFAGCSFKPPAEGLPPSDKQHALSSFRTHCVSQNALMDLDLLSWFDSAHHIVPSISYRSRYTYWR